MSSYQMESELNQFCFALTSSSLYTRF